MSFFGIGEEKPAIPESWNKLLVLYLPTQLFYLKSKIKIKSYNTSYTKISEIPSKVKISSKVKKVNKAP